MSWILKYIAYLSSVRKHRQEKEYARFRATVIENYAPFLSWLHRRHCINLKRIELVPKPRIRQGKEDPTELCFRIVVNRKLCDWELDPDSTVQWDILHGVYLSEKNYGLMETFLGLGNVPQIKIPSVLDGWPTDIVEENVGI